MEIKDLSFVEYLVKYGITQTKKSVCEEIDLQVSLWLNELRDIDFARKIVKMVRHQCLYGQTVAKYWKHILDPETLTDMVETPTHTNLKQMLKDIYQWTKDNPDGKVLSADNPHNAFYGFSMYMNVGGREVAQQFYIP